MRLDLPALNVSYSKHDPTRGGAAAEKPQMLNSWKEIARFLDRGVRTVQRWERDLQLPVHRIGKGKRSPVYAFVPELKFWVATSGVNSTHPERPVPAAN